VRWQQLLHDNLPVEPVNPLDGGQDLRQGQFKRDNSGVRHSARVCSSTIKQQLFFRKMQTTYPLKIQEMRSKGKQPRFYVSFPLALAAAIGLEGGRPRPVAGLEWGAAPPASGGAHQQHPPPTTKLRAAKK
jgi:hypothetical protein